MSLLHYFAATRRILNVMYIVVDSDMILRHLTVARAGCS